jgi:Uma2 family endonuclease
MQRQRLKKRFTPEEYLAMQEASETRSEYYNGEIFDMVGGTRDHSLIASNVNRVLGNALLDRPCEVHTSDMRLLVEAEGLYTYPDIMVICGKAAYAHGRKDTVTNPVFVVEVLSPSTRSYDRKQKVEFYAQIPSLQEYLLIDSQRPRVECLRRGEAGWKRETVIGLDAEICLASVDYALPLSEVYRKVSWG